MEQEIEDEDTEHINRENIYSDEENDETEKHVGVHFQKEEEKDDENVGYKANGNSYPQNQENDVQYSDKREKAKVRSTGNVFLDMEKPPQTSAASTSSSAAIDLEASNTPRDANKVSTKTEQTHALASGRVTVYEKPNVDAETDSTRLELIKKIEELENQRKALRQKKLIKEIQTLQTEVQGGTNEQSVDSFGNSGAPVIPNYAAPLATGIDSDPKMDTQLKALNEKIDKTSKYMEDRKKTEDLSSMSTEELHMKIEELKHRKELLSKFKQKATVINLIQNLHQQVSTMKTKVKPLVDKVIPGEKIKVFPMTPSKIDVYWNPSDFDDLKSYTLCYREADDNYVENEALSKLEIEDENRMSNGTNELENEDEMQNDEAETNDEETKNNNKIIAATKEEKKLNQNKMKVNERTNENVDDVFQTIKPELSDTSIVIDNLRAGILYEIKMEGMTNEGWKTITGVAKVKTIKPVIGFALILANHSDFKVSHLKDLPDVETDAISLKEQLEHFQFEVQLHENLNGIEMTNAVKYYSPKLADENVTCFICIVAGYMYNGHIFGKDGAPVSLHDLFEPLRIGEKENYFNYEAEKETVKLIIVDAYKVRENVIEEFDNSLQPRAVQFRSTSNSSIEASWKRPKLTKRRLKQFRVVLKHDSSSDTKTVPFNGKKDSYFYRFTSLTKNTEYNMKILAEYEDGHLGKPVKANITTFTSKFMQPQKLSVEVVSASQIFAFWIPSENTSRTILGYKVTIRDKSSNEINYSVTSYTCHLFTDLIENTEYHISVSTMIKGEIIELDEEVKDKESKPIYIDVTTLIDRTPTLMSGPTVQYVLEEPDFFFASATATNVYDHTKSSFLNTIKRHLAIKYESHDVQSIFEDVKKEIICSTDNYEIPQTLSTLRQPIFFGIKQ